MTEQPVSGGASASPVSFPHYRTRHEGTALVVGSAWCALEDYWDARNLRPASFVIAINRTAEHLSADMLVAIDRARAEHWRSSHVRRFGEGHFTMHGGRFGAAGRDAYPWFDHWWPELQVGGTSAWMAAKIAAAIGFGEIILCGVPIEPGPYINGEDNWSDRNEAMIESYRAPIRKDTAMYPLVRSMSGWTKELLGRPGICVTQA